MTIRNFSLVKTANERRAIKQEVFVNSATMTFSIISPEDLVDDLTGLYLDLVRLRLCELPT